MLDFLYFTLSRYISAETMRYPKDIYKSRFCPNIVSAGTMSYLNYPRNNIASKAPQVILIFNNISITENVNS
jgi:hypothetical protein